MGRGRGVAEGRTWERSHWEGLTRRGGGKQRTEGAEEDSGKQRRADGAAEE